MKYRTRMIGSGIPTSQRSRPRPILISPVFFTASNFSRRARGWTDWVPSRGRVGRYMRLIHSSTSLFTWSLA